MKVGVLTVLAVAACAPPSNSEAVRLDLGGTQHTGTCDASAGVALSMDLFVVGSDEDNILRIYRRDTPGQPVQELDLGPFLKLRPGQEADIEGATRIGDRIYWITSHGTNKEGEPRPARRRLFATDARLEAGKAILTPVGAPYEDLIDDLSSLAGLQAYGLLEASKAPPEQQKDASRAAGLNIEGLSGTPRQGLLMAFRSPVSIKNGEALVVPLNNPEQVVSGGRADFGTPLSLPLGGLGVRSIEYVDALGKYLIIAGPPGDKGPFSLYQWEGPPSREVAPVAGAAFRGLHPEALFVYLGGRTAVQILSDDGTVQVDGRDCKRASPDKRSFRSVWLSP